ncbi:oligosaccharyl transferase glycoprotein complex, beta subunit [Thecaphora frezii]
MRLASILHAAVLLAVSSVVAPSLTVAAASGAGPSATGHRILVVLDRPQTDYSRFIESLSSRGYDVTFKAPEQIKPQLVEHDEKAYDHLILLSPSAKSLSPDLSPQNLVNYLRDGGNVLFGFDSHVSEFFRDLAREFSVELEERGSALVDHFGFDQHLDAGNHTTLLLGPARAQHVARPVDLPSGGIVANHAVFSQQTLELAKTQPILYRGIAHRLGANPLAFPLLVPAATSYSSETPELVKEVEAPRYSTSYSQPPAVTATATRTVDDVEETYETVSTPAAVPTVVTLPPLNQNGWTVKGRFNLEPLEQKKELVAGVARFAGETVSLVSGFQLRDNSARVLFLGSIDLLRDEFWEPSASEVGYETLNARVAEDLTKWVLQETSVVRATASHHRRVRASESDVREDYEETAEGNKMYRIKDHVTYDLDVSTWVPGQGWKPAPRDLPLQVAFKMLDPYITTHLVAVDTSVAATRYTTTFQIPDRHGVFTFLVDFKRHGWSFIHRKDTAPVRPFNHDEYPRFLSASWPYIAGAFSTSLAFVVFTWFWLTLKDEARPTAAAEKKTQ